MRNALLLTLACVSGLMTMGCGKDKTVSEYQRERLQENLALYQSVAGSYTGLVTSQQDDRVLGAIQIELRAETSVNPSSGGETALGTPTLVSNIRFLADNIVALSAPTSFYDPSSGAYSAQITIRRADSGRDEQVALNGVLSGGTLRGEIGTVNDPAFGGRFTATRGGAPITQLVRQKAPGELPSDDESRQVRSYLGSTTFTAGGAKPVTVVVVQPVRGTAEDFLDLMSPVKSVQVSFNYSQSLHVQFPAAVLDLRQGLLTGQTTLNVNGQSQQMTLECRVGADVDLVCKHVTTASGVTATTRAKEAKQNTSVPREDTAAGRSVTKVFRGRGKLGGTEGVMTLSVTRPSRGRLVDLLELFFPPSEQLLNVAVTISEGVTISLGGIKWDMLNGLLDGSSPGQTGGDSYTVYLQCHDFYFDQTSGPFRCDYRTSRSPNISIHFKPPYR